MPDRTEPLKENDSTYMVEDRKNSDEMARLDVQDRMVTAGMGGPLPELEDATRLRRVLDVGCGTGGWLLETARTYPTIEKLFGGDISGQILAYARAQAESAGLSDRVQFKTMDALRILEFPTGYFDLVNQRLGQSWLRIWDWTKLLLEYQRVCSPGGIIRIAECNQVESNTPALQQLLDIMLDTFHRSGRFFTPKPDGITSKLPHLMTQHGIQDVQTRTCTLTFQGGTQAGQDFSEDMARLFRVLIPFLQKWTRLPNNYDEIYQQAVKEMQQPDFTAKWVYVTIWGIRPRDGQTLLMRGLK